MKRGKAIKPVFELTDANPVEEVGYCRVSIGRDQSVDMQKDALLKRGIPEDNIYEDTKSGGTLNRPGLQNALKLMRGRPGWTLVVWKLDRLARSLEDLMTLNKMFEQEGWNLVSLTEQFDTRTPMGRAFFYIIGVIAQLERDMLRERTMAGMQRKREMNQNIGRPPSITDEQYKEIEDLLLNHPNLSLPQIAKRIKVKIGNKWKEISVGTITYHFPQWRSKTFRERQEHRKKNPFNPLVRSYRRKRTHRVEK